MTIEIRYLLDDKVNETKKFVYQVWGKRPFDPDIIKLFKRMTACGFGNSSDK